MRQLFAGSNIPHRDEHDLPLDRDIWVAGMVGVEHAAFSLLLSRGSDEEIFRDLDFSGPEFLRQRRPFLLGENVASLDGHNLSGRKRALRKEAFAVDRALPHFRLWGPMSQVGHSVVRLMRVSINNGLRAGVRA